MPITAITTDWGTSPRIVRITTTDNLATITTSNYLIEQEAIIETLNNGSFEFLNGDFFAIDYADGEGFFTRDSALETFEAFPTGLSATLNNGNIFVGNASNIATGVTPSGDITLTNAGVFGIASGAIVNADVNASAAISFSKLQSLPSAEILVGNGSNEATPVNLSGDATLANTGALTVANNAITSDKLDSSTIKYVVVNVTNAEFLTAYATPVLLIAAQGANTQIVLHTASFLYNYLGVQYTLGGAVHIQYDLTANGNGTKASTTQASGGITGASFNMTFQLTGTQGIVASSTTLNKGLYLSNATQNFATGNGIFKIAIWYSVLSFA